MSALVHECINGSINAPLNLDYYDKTAEGSNSCQLKISNLNISQALLATCLHHLE